MVRRAYHALIQTRRKRKTAQTGTEEGRKASAAKGRSVLKDTKNRSAVRSLNAVRNRSATRTMSVQRSLSVQTNLSTTENLNATRGHRHLQLHSRLQKEDRKNLSARREVKKEREETVETATEGTITATATTETAGKRNRKGAMRLKGIILGALLLMMAAGCTRPVQKSSYISLNRLSGWEEEIPLKLTFEMTDTIGESELYLIGEIATKRTIGEKTGYPIILTFLAPDSTSYTDTVTLPLHVIQDGKIARTSHGIREIEWPYRKNIYNKIPGMWEVTITKADTLDDYSNIIGLGIRCKQLSYER